MLIATEKLTRCYLKLMLLNYHLLSLGNSAGDQNFDLAYPINRFQASFDLVHDPGGLFKHKDVDYQGDKPEGNWFLIELVDRGLTLKGLRYRLLETVHVRNYVRGEYLDRNHDLCQI